MIPRAISDKIRELNSKFPILTITGSRQSGKTTLSQHLFPDYEHVTLENPSVREFARTDTKAFLERYNNHVIFDEAQRVPDLFSYLQGIVDDRDEPGQFVLTGSQNFLLMKNITQSLAGRVAVTYLLPLSHSEMTNANINLPTVYDWVWKGGYPRMFASSIDPNDFFPNYIDTYVERDIREELGVRKLSEFRRFLVQCALRCGEIVNNADLARDCGIDGKTVEEWLSVLETSFIAFRLYPYYKNYGKRLVKSPKLYFYDTGLAANLLAMESADDLRFSQQRGNLFENAVASEIIKQYYAVGRRPRLYYWRDYSKKEIDFIIEKGGAIQYAIEVKASSTYDSHAFATISTMADVMELSNDQRIVIYGGGQSLDTSFGRLLTINDIPSLVNA